MRKLGSVADIVMGASPPGDTYNVDAIGHPLLNGPTEFGDEYPTPCQWTSAATRLCRPGDVLLCVRGSSTGRLNIANAVYCLGRGLAAVRGRDGVLDTTYLFHALERGVQLVRRLSAGSTFPNIDRKNLSSIEFHCPAIAEQRTAGRMLGSWRKATLAIARLIEYKRRLKRGLMQELLTGKRRFKEFDGSDWRSVRLEDLFEEVSRPVIWDDEEGYELLSVRRRSGGVFLRSVTQGSAIKTKSLFQVRVGDFLISKMQVVHGALGMVRPEFEGKHVSGSYVVLRNKRPDILRTEMFDHVSRLPQTCRLALLASYGVHIEKMTFNLPWYLRSRIRIPAALEEQDRVVAVLDALDREIALLMRLQDALDGQRRGVAELLLTGKVRVPEAVS